MTFKTIAQNSRARTAALMAALALVAGIAISTADPAHACRPDMSLWTHNCGAR